MNDPFAQHNPYKPWQSSDKPEQSTQPLDDHLAVPDQIAQRLAQTRRQAVQDLEQQHRRRRTGGTSPLRWTLGAGFAIAALSAVVIAPQLSLTTPATATTNQPLPPALIAADEELEFFESLDLLEWSIENESTS